MTKTIGVHWRDYQNEINERVLIKITPAFLFGWYVCIQGMIKELDNLNEDLGTEIAQGAWQPLLDKPMIPKAFDKL